MTFRPLVLAISAALSAAIPLSVAAMPPADAWEIGPVIKGRSYSIGMPRQPDAERGGAVGFAFPVEGEVDALTTAVGSLEGARQITMRYRIEAARGTRFVPSEAPDQTATVSLYLQRAGDTWSARGKYSSYRWYVPVRAVMPITPGTHTVTIRFDEQWTNVFGVPNTDDPQGFAATMRNTARIGVAFGSAGLRSHGVYATGPARFTLLSLDID
ncbi:hypothetical protein WAB17_06870 [Parerythrobacter aurantius]|uniref:hypothetical protein n=1 Tax=Parerythrobacter aurantius TaxID=3127706 RepID=UPI00324FC43E